MAGCAIGRYCSVIHIAAFECNKRVMAGITFGCCFNVSRWLAYLMNFVVAGGTARFRAIDACVVEIVMIKDAAGKSAWCVTSGAI